MAGDWFPMALWRSRCPEIVLVSSLTGRDRHEVLGWLCDFWSWVSGESSDGHVRGVYVHNLPSVIGADGPFWDALKAAKWLDEDTAGIVVPHWDNWLSESAKKRFKERIKKRSQRAKDTPKKVSPKCPVNVPDLSPKCPQNVPPTVQERIEKKEEEPPNPLPGEPTKTAALAVPVPIPAELDTPDFRTAWAEWKAERRARKAKPYTFRGETQLLADLAKYGPQIAIKAISESTRMGWAGLFPEKIGKGSSNGYKTADEKLAERTKESLKIAFGVNHYEPDREEGERP